MQLTYRVEAMITNQRIGARFKRRSVQGVSLHPHILLYSRHILSTPTNAILLPTMQTESKLHQTVSPMKQRRNISCSILDWAKTYLWGKLGKFRGQASIARRPWEPKLWKRRLIFLGVQDNRKIWTHAKLLHLSWPGRTATRVVRSALLAG